MAGHKPSFGRDSGSDLMSSICQHFSRGTAMKHNAEQFVLAPELCTTPIISYWGRKKRKTGRKKLVFGDGKGGRGRKQATQHCFVPSFTPSQTTTLHVMYGGWLGPIFFGRVWTLRELGVPENGPVRCLQLSVVFSRGSKVLEIYCTPQFRLFIVLLVSC